MTNNQQQIWIRLRKRDLRVQRVNDHGNRIGKKTKWTIGKKSALPRELFFKVMGYLRNSIKRTGTNSTDKLRISCLRALAKTAGTCGCESKFGQSKADVYWNLNGTVFIAWQIHDDAINIRRTKKLTSSKALLRIVIVLKKSGYFRILPQDTREPD